MHASSSPIPLESNPYTIFVARIFDIDDITAGTAQQNFLYRYRGLLRGDSQAAYDQLAQDLRQYNLLPLFRKDGDRHTIFLVHAPEKPKPQKHTINLILFILTVISVVFAGALFSFIPPGDGGPNTLEQAVWQSLGNGLLFAVSLLAILLAHEFGHYLAGRRHGVDVTLPYFVPFPLSPFGTMGAFIQLREPPKNKRMLLDIGITGPLAGLIVAIPVLLIGLSLSSIEPIVMQEGGFMLEGNSLLYLLAKLAVFKQLLPAPVSYAGLSPVIYWIRYFFTGQPLPIGGMDVIIHPVAWAGWAGLLVTAINLIPAGQLDGGHIIYVLLGKRARYLLPFILVGLILLGFFWFGWWLWAGLILLLGRMYAEPLDQITTLDSHRKAIAVLGIIIFILVFTPVPLISIGG